MSETELPDEQKILWSLYIAADEMRRTIAGSKVLNPDVWLTESIEQQLEKWKKTIEKSFEYVMEDRATPQISGLKQVREALLKLSEMSEIRQYSLDDDVEFELEHYEGIAEKSLATLDGIIAGQDAPTPAQPEKVDVEKLKREVEAHVSDLYARTVLSAVRYAIDHLATTYDFVKKV